MLTRDYDYSPTTAVRDLNRTRTTQSRALRMSQINTVLSRAGLNPDLRFFQIMNQIDGLTDTYSDTLATEPNTFPR